MIWYTELEGWAKSLYLIATTKMENPHVQLSMIIKMSSIDMCSILISQKKSNQLHIQILATLC